MTLPSHAPVLIDIAGTTLSATDRRRLRHPLVGGVVLFGRHWVDRTQLSALCRSIRKVRADLLICVDHEGGRVQRFRTDGFTAIPPMSQLGAQWMRDPMAAVQSAAAAGWLLASELRACGVDLSFAPVLDLDWGRSSVIGTRAFHADPRVVTLLAQSLMHGMLQAGMAHCGKHFPGHGHVRADSHVDVPVDPRSLRAVRQADMAPFAWLAPGLTAVMPAHVIYPKVDARPAGFSRRWLQDILRTELGFDGAIFSDDLSMAGARVLEGQPLSYAQAACHALQAGCDLVLLCNQSLPSAPEGGRAPDLLLDELAAALAAGEWQASGDSERRRRALLPLGAPPAWDTLVGTPRYRRAREQLAGV